MVKNVLKKNGFSKYRYVFTGYHSETGVPVSFFIELDMLNPAVSPGTVQSNLHIPKIGSDPVLCAVLPSTTSVVPSYFAVRCGIYGSGGCIFESFYPVSILSVSKKELKITCDVCTVSDTEISGSVSDSAKGVMSWNLHIEKKAAYCSVKLQRDLFWNTAGIKTLFSGSVCINSDTWLVSPAISNGYSDMLWGKTYPAPFFHLSSPHLQSLISGKLLSNSCFTVQGVCCDTVSVFADFESEDSVQHISYVQKRDKVRFNCTTADSKVHWTVSAENRGFLLDIDVFCNTDCMMLRKYELPAATAAELHVLSGASGDGEIKLYRRNRKNLEQIEHLKLEHVYCEYGSIDASV